LPQFPPQIPSCSPPSVSRPSTVPMRRSRWPNIGARIRHRAGTGFISEPARAKPGVMVGCPGWICPLRVGSRVQERQNRDRGASWWVARLDLPASVGYRAQERQTWHRRGRVGGLRGWICPLRLVFGPKKSKTRFVWRFLVLWRLIFRRGIRFGSFDGRRVPVSGAFSPWNLDSRVLSSRKTNVERPREPITPPIPPFDAGFDFRDQNPPLERRVLASVQRCNQVMQRGSEP
jgi:hypothetical protein